MATKTISCSGAGSGKSSYGEYASMMYLGGGYRARASFSMSGIPAGSKITAVKIYMTHSSSIYAEPQSVSFAAASSGNWSYSSAGSGGGTSSQSSGNTYVWNAGASLGQAMLSLGSGYLHMSSGDSQARPYSGISVSVTYTEPETTYTVKCAKGSYGSGTDKTLTKKKGTALTLPGAIFTRNGYTQTGWSTSTYGNTLAYSLGGSYTTDADATLYPYWTADGPATYSVTYRPGTHGSGSVRYQTKTDGVALTLLGAVFTRDGYTQTGWSATDGGAKAYNLGGSYTQNAPITLYPYWTANGLPLYRWDGENAILCNMYRWDGGKTMAVYIHSRVKDGEK